jgi:hypothetical protein
LASLAFLVSCTTTAERERLAGVSCPRAAVLAQAASVTKFRPGAEANAANVLTRASMSQPTLDCTYRPGEGHVSVDVSIPVTVKGQGATLSYFVAVLDSSGNVVSKETYSVNVGSDSVESAEVDNRVIALGADTRPYDYQVLTGFQLSAAELSYNQSQRNFRP